MLDDIQEQRDAAHFGQLLPAQGREMQMCCRRRRCLESLVGLVDTKLLGKSSKTVVLDNVLFLPWIADPNISDVLGRVVSHALAKAALDLVLALGQVLGQDRESTALAACLLLVVDNKDGEASGSKVLALLLGKVGDGVLDVLEELRVCVLEGGPGVIDLVDDKNILAEQSTSVLALLDLAGTLVAGNSLGVEPLSADDLVTDLTLCSARDLLVQAQADSLDGDVAHLGRVECRRLLKESSEHTSGVESTTADGDHEIRVELGLDPASGLADLDVDVLISGTEVVIWELLDRHCVERIEVNVGGYEGVAK